jgi:hypothetical protein
MGLTARVKNVLDIMVSEGVDRKTAVARIGISDRKMREALSNPVVLAYYNDGLTALRTAEKARNIHVAAAIRDRGAEPDASAAMGRTAVEAIKFLHGETGGSQNINIGIGVKVTPGYVMDLGDAPRRRVIDEDVISVTDAPLADEEAEL